MDLYILWNPDKRLFCVKPGTRRPLVFCCPDRAAEAATTEDYRIVRAELDFPMEAYARLIVERLRISRLLKGFQLVRLLRFEEWVQTKVLDLIEGGDLDVPDSPGIDADTDEC